MNGKDLGTYHLRVEFADGRGFIQTWHTGWRYSHGSGDETKLDADAISPTWGSERELFDTVVFMYTDGNYSCDCNKALFLARAHQEAEPDNPCGDEMALRKLTAIRPDRSEVVLFEAGK